MSCDAGQNDHRASVSIDTYGLAVPPKLARLRCYTMAFTIGPDSRAAEHLDQEICTLGLAEVQLLDVNGNVLAWADRFVNVNQPIGADQFNRLQMKDRGEQTWDLSLFAETVLVLADGSAVYADGSEAPPMIGPNQ